MRSRESWDSLADSGSSLVTFWDCKQRVSYDPASGMVRLARKFVSCPFPSLLQGGRSPTLRRRLIRYH